MPFEEQRSLLEIGGKDRSSAITLPAGWVRFWKLKKGQKLDIIVDRIVVIIPPTHPELDELKDRIRGVVI